MKRLKISPLLTIAMAIQMIVSPIAHAQSSPNALDFINLAGQMMQQNQQNLAASRQAQANQQLIGQMTAPGRDKYFNTDSLSRIPGLMEYMALNGLNPATLTCPTLPTTLTEIRAEVCRLGVVNDRGAQPQAQLSEMFSLYKTYGDVAKQYEAYKATSNAEGQGFGVGCMRNAVQTLGGFFAYRINELDKLTTNLEALNNQFREASKVDLNAIEESTAVLDGGSSELTDEVRSRRPDLFDFAKRFDNPACKSMFAGDTLNTLGTGRPGGLNRISKVMKDEFSAKSGKFSGESYVGAHASVVDDINKMADKAAQQFQLNFTGITSQERGYSEFLGNIPNSISSTSGVVSLLRGDFFADSQMNFNKQNSKILADLSTLRNELRAAGADPSAALSVANNLNATNFESEVTLVQNQLRNGCLTRAFSGAGFWDRIKKNIQDPEASRFANKNAFNSIREQIEEIMTNTRTTPEAKVQQLQALEQANGSRFILNMQGSYQKSVIQNGRVVTTNVSPSARAPSAYFNDVVQTCDAQFSTNKLGSAMTGSSAISKLREINQQYKTLASNQMNNIRNEIRRKLIECDTENEASNQQAGSCTKDRFNTTTPGFCANAAFTCANNMKSCTTQADNFVKQIKTERTARVNNYKALVQKNKSDIVRIFDTALAKYMREGEAMRGLFGAGFTSPAGIKREVAGDKFLSKFREATQDSPDGALLLEDPDKYVEMFKGNIELLKKEVTKQQQEILGTGNRGGLLAQHIDQTDRNYTTAAAAAKSISDTCIAKHDEYIRADEARRQQQMAEMQKRQNELGERRQQVCELYNRAQSDAQGACSETIQNVVGVSSVYGQFRDDCRRNGFHQEAPADRDSSNSRQRAVDICTERGLIGAAAPAPAAETRSPGAQTDAQRTPPPTTGPDTSLRGLCSQVTTNFRTNCPAESAPTAANPNAVAQASGCVDIQLALIVSLNRREQNGGSDSGPASFPDAPAECSAGFNGDRSVPEGGSLMGADRIQVLSQIIGQ